jgi:hypothetical protein
VIAQCFRKTISHGDWRDGDSGGHSILAHAHLAGQRHRGSTYPVHDGSRTVTIATGPSTPNRTTIG